VTLVVTSEEGPVSLWLARAYYAAAELMGSSVRGWSLWPARSAADGREAPRAIPWDTAVAAEFTWQLPDPAEPGRWVLSWERDGGLAIAWLERRRIDDPQSFFGRPFEPGILGMALEIEGPAAGPRFEGERGWVRWSNQQSLRHALVQTELAPIDGYLPPFGIERRGALTPEAIQRTYDETNGWIMETHTKRKSPWPRGQLGAALAEIIERRLRENVRSVIDDAH
jgi:hypothetical protein